MNEIKKSELIRNEIDASVKSLITPTTFVVAMTLLYNSSKENPSSNPWVIYPLIFIFAVFIVMHFLLTAKILKSKAEEIIGSKLIARCFWVAYMTIFMATTFTAFVLALTKLSAN